MKPGDWGCVCGERNFASRGKCRVCLKQKPLIKPGDWRCACGEVNFAARTKCRACNTTGGGEPRAGDWRCTCGELNFASRTQCRKCSATPEGKHVEVPAAAELVCDVEATADVDACIICMDNKRQCMAAPCRHASFCVKCAIDMWGGTKVGNTKCPKCRADVTSVLRVFD
jgi:Zinc finger, C3HC4 type (RING finger)